MNKIKQKACVSFIEQIVCSAPYPKRKHHLHREKYFSLLFSSSRWFLFSCLVIFQKHMQTTPIQKPLLPVCCHCLPSFECETFLHVLHGKQYDKQVQGGSVHIIEPGTWHLAPGTWHLAPGTWHLAPGTWHLAPGTWHLAPGTWHLAPGTWHLAPGTWHLAPGTWHLAPGTWHLAPGTWHLAPH